MREREILLFIFDQYNERYCPDVHWQIRVTLHILMIKWWLSLFLFILHDFLFVRWITVDIGQVDQWIDSFLFVLFVDTIIHWRQPCGWRLVVFYFKYLYRRIHLVRRTNIKYVSIQFWRWRCTKWFVK